MNTPAIELYRGKGLDITKEDGASRQKVQETAWNGEDFVCSWRPVRLIPADEGFFENI